MRVRRKGLPLLHRPDAVLEQHVRVGRAGVEYLGRVFREADRGDRPVVRPPLHVVQPALHRRVDSSAPHDSNILWQGSRNQLSCSSDLLEGDVVDPVEAEVDLVIGQLHRPRRPAVRRHRDAPASQDIELARRTQPDRVERQREIATVLQCELVALRDEQAAFLGVEPVRKRLAQRTHAPAGLVARFEHDEFLRPDTTIEILARLRPAFREGRSVTAGNSSGLNDGACALLVASDEGVKQHSLEPVARLIAAAAAGVEPRTMGIGPVPATRKVLAMTRLSPDHMDVIEINEAFAAQVLACTRELGLADSDPRVNPNGGAIALGHPLGMSGARLILTAMRELRHAKGKYALCTMCVGVGQGMAVILERV